MDVRLFDEDDVKLFVESCEKQQHKINVYNQLVKSAANIQDFPGYPFAAATINLQTLTEPLNDGKGRRIVDLDASQSQESARSVSRLAGLRQIIASTAFGQKPNVSWLLQEVKCPVSCFTKILRPLDQRRVSYSLSYNAIDSGSRKLKGTSAIMQVTLPDQVSSTPPDFVFRIPGVIDQVMKISMEPKSGRPIGVVSHYSSSSPRSTRHAVLPINNPLGKVFKSDDQAFTVWDQLLDTLMLMNCCKESCMSDWGSFYLHWLPRPGHRHRGCVNSFKTLTATIRFHIINMRGTKTDSKRETMLDYMLVNFCGDFVVTTVED